jgi:hypothetical protein
MVLTGGGSRAAAVLTAALRQRASWAGAVLTGGGGAQRGAAAAGFMGGGGAHGGAAAAGFMGGGLGAHRRRCSRAACGGDAQACARWRRWTCVSEGQRVCVRRWPGMRVGWA